MILDRFPRAAKYNPEWVTASVSGAGHALLLAEWLASALDLRPGMRVLDLGCGRAASSIFLAREFGVEVWATDLWFDASENMQRVRDAELADRVFPINADARSLPFAAEFFDAIIAIDSFPYYGTDDLYLSYLARYLKPDGKLGIAGAGLMREIEGSLPDHLREWWTPDLWCLHSADWWRRHWERVGLVEVELSDSMPDGWQLWLDWHRIIAPDNVAEINAIEADQGRYIGYVRVVAKRRPGVVIPEHIEAVKTQYVRKPLVREME